MSSPASLRELYAPPSAAWTFSPPTNASQPEVPSSSSSSYQWSTRPSSNPLFGLSPSGGDEGGLDVIALAQGAVSYIFMRYAGAAVALPWEVGKTLLQVQWVPQDSHVTEEPDFAEGEEQHEDDALSDSSVEHESYFADPADETTDTRTSHPLRPVDERGYIARQSVTDPATIPQYVIPVGSAAGASGMMFRVKNFKTEGWTSLWKGLTVSTATAILQEMIQPVVHSILEIMVSPAVSYSPPPLLIPVASQILTGFILSPLDLIRTRLMVQSADRRFRTYNGTLDAFDQIATYEGGFRGIYFHPHLLFPTIIDCTLRSIVPFVLPSLIAAYFQISNETHPFMRNLVELAGNCASLLITLPFETVRRRLQVQTRGMANPLKACVELRPRPYNGMVDAFWHILTEERSDLPLKPKKRKGRQSVDNEKEGAAPQRAEGRAEQHDSDSWLRHTGIGQLYRGLSLRIGASVFVFVLAAFVGRDEPDAGWAEL